MRKVLLVGLLAFLLAGCAAAPVLPPRPAAQEIMHFAFVGRLAVRQGDTHHHVKVDWRHDAGRDEILLTTPLGQGIAELVRDASGARLTLADRRSFVAPDANALAREVLGFPLPLNGAARWLLGDIGAPADWNVRVTERESAQPDALPTVIEFEREEVFVRLKIDEWIEAR
ncbi:MAG: outer membrane lipoprotein LolB [Sulfuritalea sp.]|nr:outer membrane lipoprotein LolB [Sulfuritalea sp.]